MFLRLGMSGYQNIIDAIMSNARYLEQKLLDSGYFEVLTDSNFLPTVVVKLKGAPKFSAFHISDELRKNGWIVPAYTLPAEANEIVVLRMVIKENFSRDLAEKLFSDTLRAVEYFENLEGITQTKTKTHGVC